MISESVFTSIFGSQPGLESYSLVGALPREHLQEELHACQALQYCIMLGQERLGPVRCATPQTCGALWG